MSKEKLLSIIIPTYNRSDKLIRAINSVETQNPDLIEIIICDDLSSDFFQNKNISLINQLNKEKLFPITYLENYKNKGVSGARNCAIEKSQGKWLLFLDDDDEFTEDYIDVLIEEIKDTNFDFIWPDLYFKYSQNTISKWQSSIKTNQINQRDVYKEVISLGMGFGICLRKSKIVECNGFNESFLVAEDTELILNLIKHKCLFSHIPIFGVIKYEDSDEMLSKDLKRYFDGEVIPRLLNSYFNFLVNYLDLYSGLMKRGKVIYFSQKKYLEYFFFFVKYFFKSKKIKQLYKIYKN